MQKDKRIKEESLLERHYISPTNLNDSRQFGCDKTGPIQTFYLKEGSSNNRAHLLFSPVKCVDNNVFSPCPLLPPANEVWGKVIFLHLPVILFTRGEYPPRPGTPPWTRYTPLDQVPPPRPGTPPNQVPPWTRYPPDQVHPPRAGTPPTPGRYGQQAGGMHPTGMHSCS